jgi:predicted DNA-binding mobile mystery protein A
MKKRKTPLSERMRIDKALKDIRKCGYRFKTIDVHRWIRDLRKRMNMSQKQLAKRSQITQPQLSQIESGRAKVTMETLGKVFEGLFCDLLICPFPRIEIEEVLRKQAYFAAKKKLASLHGSMALEDQVPPKEFLEKKIQEVADDLIRSGSTEIWDL